MFDSGNTAVQIDLFAPGAIPEKSSELTCLSVGLGQDSTALLYKFAYDAEFRRQYAPGRLVCIFSDTGDEHPQTYKHLEHVKAFCSEHDIEFVHIEPSMGFHGNGWHSLREQYNLHSTCGSKGGFAKSCTDRLKLGPIYRYLEHWIGREYDIHGRDKSGIKKFAQQHGKIKMIVGIAHGEEKRVKKEKARDLWQRVAIETIYPLIDLKMDRQACQDYIVSVGHEVPMPSNCILCPYLSLQELLWLHRFMPADLEDWIRIEENKIVKHALDGDRTKTMNRKGEIKNNLGVWGTKLLPEVLQEAIDKFGHLSDAELHEFKMSHGHCVASQY